MNWTATIERYLAEGRTVSGGKGDSEIQAQEAQQQGFNRQLANIFGTQFGRQSGILNFLTGKLTGQVNNPTGLDPTTEAAMRTNATETAAKDYAAASKATGAAVAARGGSTLPSGVSAQLAAENANAGAAENTTAQTNITLADQNLKQQNYWNSINGLNGVSAEENPLGYGGEYNSGSGTVANLGTAYYGTQNSPGMAAVGGVVGGAVGGLSKLNG